jgi:GH15 family glucan-1,4-alpha-glucosidase
LAAGFDTAFNAYKAGWSAYDATLTNPRVEKLAVSVAQRKQLKDAYYLSANVIKASEDKTFPGAIVASLASPWGQAVSAGDPNNTYFGSYREVFARDLYESWTGLVAAGDLDTARDATLFLFERQQLPDGSFPRNSLVNGKVAPDSFGTQLDEVAFPILMAYQLGLTDSSLFEDHIKPAANYVAAHGPAFGVERWEEQSGYSPSTIASEIAGLVAAAELGDGERRRRLRSGLAGRGRRDAALGQGLDRDDERAAVGRARTSSGCRRPAIRTPRSTTTSATAARRSTSAR